MLLLPTLALVLAATPARRPRAPRGLKAAETRSPQLTGPGSVSYVTADSVFLNRGKRDGLELGRAVPVWRGNRQVGTCAVSAVSESAATCTGAGLRVGDRIDVTRAATKPTPALAALPADAELDRRRAQLEAQPWALVDDAATGSAVRGALGLSVALSHLTSVEFGAKRTVYNLERLDVRVHELKLLEGLSVTVDGALQVYSRPSSTHYTGGQVTPLVQRALVKWRPKGLPLVAQVGRLRPKGTIGLNALDGAQLGWCSAQGDLEAGVYGGLLPTSTLLNFSTTRWAVGAYGAARLVSGDGSGGSMLQAEASAGWVSRPNLGTRMEVGLAAHGWLGRSVDAHASALLSSGSPLAPALVDVVSLDVGVRRERWRLQLAGRYRGNPYLETALPGVALPTIRGLHGSVDGAFEVTPWLELGAHGGAAVNDSGAFWVGPEVTLTRLFDGKAALGVGYEEELGTTRGRSAWAEGTLRLSPRLRFSARASWAMQRIPVTLGAADLGGTLGVEVRPVSFGWVRLSTTWRSSFNVDGGAIGLGLRGSLLQVFAQVGAEL